MFNRKLIFSICVVFTVTSCGDTWDSVKRGLTGAKKKSADEFLVEKKDPLVLPPDFENLPIPSDPNALAASEQAELKLEKTLGKIVTESEEPSEESSTETLILKKIRKQ